MNDYEWIMLCLLVGGIIIVTVLIGCFFDKHKDEILSVKKEQPYDEHEDFLKL